MVYSVELQDSFSQLPKASELLPESLGVLLWIRERSQSRHRQKMCLKKSGGGRGEDGNECTQESMHMESWPARLLNWEQLKSIRSQ